MKRRLKPGRELDALVADKVMQIIEPQGRHYTFRLAEETYLRRLKQMDKCPNYSTDMTSAWLVFQKLEKVNQVTILTLSFPEKLGTANYIVGWRGVSSGDVSAKTLPHALCLAALKAFK